MGLKKHRIIIFRLELERETLFELPAAKLSSPLTIGRHADCAWVIPSIDRSASNHHARIVKRHGAYYIEDMGSRNGLYFNGEKITSHRLAVGDQIGVGDCKLWVEESAESSEAVADHNRLEQLNGKRKGTIYSLEKEMVRIGSSRDCDIVFEDNVVSTLHASIEQKPDGSAWIHDLGSRNGTTVNGAKLSNNTNDSGRLLRDGDIISVAHIELRYWDKYVTHVRSHLWLKIVVVVLVSALILGGYFVWQGITPSAKKYVDAARRCARNRQFEAARHCLEMAANSRGAEFNKFERAELADKIGQWEATASGWEEVKGLLKQRKWIIANNQLSQMTGNDMELWRWNDTDATQSKNEALEVKKLLDVFLASRATLGSRDSTREQLAAAADTLSKSLEVSTLGTLEFAAPLVASATNISNELGLVAQELAGIEKTLATSVKSYQLRTAIEKLMEIRTTSQIRVDGLKKQSRTYSPTVAQKLQGLLPPLEKLADAKDCLDRNYALAAQFKFDDIAESLPLPPIDTCNVSPYLSEKRRELDVLNSQLLANVKQLRSVVKTVHAHGVEPGKVPPSLAALTNRKVLEAVLSCDCFERPLPKWSRSEPAGEYDRIVGIEAMYTLLQSLPETCDLSGLADLSFTPVVTDVRTLFSTLDVYLKFIKKDTMSMVFENDVENNEVAKLALTAYELQEMREKFLKSMTAEAAKDDGRRAVIAGGLALMIGEGTGLVSAGLADETGVRFKRLRLALAELKKTETTPEAVIANRTKLIAQGIPGDPQIKSAWIELRKEVSP